MIEITARQTVLQCEGVYEGIKVRGTATVSEEGIRSTLSGQIVRMNGDGSESHLGTFSAMPYLSLSLDGKADGKARAIAPAGEAVDAFLSELQTRIEAEFAPASDTAENEGQTPSGTPAGNGE